MVRVLGDALADTLEVIHLAAQVDFEAEIVRETFDGVVRAPALARVGVVRFGEDEANVVPARLAELLLISGTVSKTCIVGRRAHTVVDSRSANTGRASCP